ncbi:MAG: 2,3-bisphosphoglycerate-independent phosphoglycerate mutase [Clostridia bacterium]|nr:2,3-bisphosphoglycerate-independent phosphoglycerate mutase [Clostridia bacterium]
MTNKLTALIILDGYGINEKTEGNAIFLADTPNMDKYLNTYPNSLLMASGYDVGLPKGQMGNSEVGHTNIGAGRIVYQDLVKITKSIEDGDFFENEIFMEAVKNCQTNNSALHLMGLLSDGGVHSHNTHLYALLELAKKAGINDVYIHLMFDGRDVPPDSSLGYITELTEKIKENGTGKIASIMGRFYAMDRDNVWDRVEKAYNAMVFGEGEKSDDAVQAVKDSYDRKIFDEFILPTVITENTKPVGLIKENDSIIFFNFRPDRARQITRSFVEPEFKSFVRKKGYFKNYFVCMTPYDATFNNVHIAYEKEELTNTFGEYISKKGLTQLRIAETQKYAHVTFFFNGGVETPYLNEDRALIDSPRIETFDLKPEMSAYEVKDEVIKRIESGKYDVIILNFANCDMVGHTGSIPATVKAVEAVDDCLGQVVDAILKVHGTALITADHGNAEQMLDDAGNVMTAHSILPVPLIYVSNNTGRIKLVNGRLADLTPTMLDIMNIDKPEQMTGESLIIKNI